MKAVILNDTRGDAHFGCMRVMRLLENSLEQRGIAVLATSLVRNDWENDSVFLEAMRASDLIVVNGEGTLHHGARQGDRLLRVASHHLREGKRLALINSLYQDNPAEWGMFLSRFDLLAARDAASQREMQNACGKPVLLSPDISLSAGAIPMADHFSRSLVTIGDSVEKSVSRSLARLAGTLPESRLVTIQSRLKLPKPSYPAPLRVMRDIYSRAYETVARFSNRRLVIPSSEAEFIDWLCQSRLHVTGRFHAVCFCLATGTPFLAVRSNSRKIEELLDYFGLGQDRVVPADRLEQAVADSRFAVYSDTEKIRIENGLANAAKSAAVVFDALASLPISRQ